MEYEIKNQKLIIKPAGDLNLTKIESCQHLINQYPDNIIIFELAKVRNISSEGIKFFFQLKKAGKQLKLPNKSAIFSESLLILGLKDFFA